MATIIGRNATVHVSTDGGSTYVAVGKVKSAALKTSHDIADETNNDSAGWKEKKIADSEGSLEVSFKYSSTDAGQAMIAAAAIAKSSLTVRFRPQASTSEFQFVFTGLVSDYSIDTETGSVEDSSCTFESTGAVVKSAQ